MKSFLKGILFGICFIATNRFCCMLFGSDYYTGDVEFASAVVFFLVATAFLVSKNVTELLLCGFVGLFVMFFGEIFFVRETDNVWFDVYLGGFVGSMVALCFSIILTLKKVSIFKKFSKGEISLENGMNKSLKFKLIIYSVISAVGFTYFVLPENSAISVPLFCIIQFLCLWFIVPDPRRLYLFAPIFIMSLNCMWSAGNIWRTSNLIISAVLYGCMFMDIDFKNDSLKFFKDMVSRVFMPFAYFAFPFKWVVELSNTKAPLIKRVLLALAISIPCVLILTAMLSSADMVFSLKTEKLLESILDCIRFHTLFLIGCGIVAGLYLFGTMYSAHFLKDSPNAERCETKGDMVIINILLFAVLFVYTLFVVIQFKYLFAGSELPEGLTFTQYARKGFFELIALTGVNIAAILAAVKLTKNHRGKWLMVTKGLCHYLCVVTIILLVSSFYRMMLYTNDDGLTRLRFFVMGFLVFEALGLMITFVYIARPRFNISAIYVAIALVYYTVLNVIPADNIIAKNQINKYLSGERMGLEYIFTLSADAAPAMDYLYNNTDDEQLKANIESFLKDKTASEIPRRWQRYNLSIRRAENILKNN